MAPDKATYTSTSLRERDQLLIGQHQAQLNDLQRRHAYVERNLNVKLFDVTNRGRKLAELLGYSSVDEALVDVESAGIGSLRDIVHSVQAAKARQDLEHIEVQILQAKLDKVQREHRELMAKNKALESAHRKLANEHKDLIVKYDKLADVRQRAGERYKADYLTWKKFYFWLISDKPDSEHPEISEKEKQKIGKWKPGVLQKRQDIIEGRINVSFLGGYSEDTPGVRKAPPFGGIEMECDKENEGTPIPPRKKRRITPTPSSPTPLSSNALLISITNFNSPAKPSPRLPTSTLKPLSIQPALSKPSPTRVPLSSIPEPLCLSPERDPNTSETEDDSQPVWLPKKQPEQIAASKVATPPIPTPPLPRASSSKLGVGANLPPQHPTTAQPSAAEFERIYVNDGEDNPFRRPSAHEQPSKFTSRVFLSSGKGKERQVEDSYRTPLQDKSDKCIRPDDYSVFKGRGRYGKSAKATEPTLNARYVIDPSNNGGLDYQYDEVVRSRDARRKMHGGDCECCREYYEGVGPLPARLQQPLWRSPTNSPQKDRLNRHRADVESHKKAISRHRHTWARPPTPPGYWDIGFPNTQEVTEINKKAAEMHRRKQEEIEREAARASGRYRRRS